MKKGFEVQGFKVARTSGGDVLIKGKHGGVPLEFEIPCGMEPKQMGGLIGSNLPGRHPANHGLRLALRDAVTDLMDQ